MAEYLVKLEVAVLSGLIFPKKYHTAEVYEAETAKEARQKCIDEFKRECRKEGIDPEEDDINFAITDIKKI